MRPQLKTILICVSALCTLWLCVTSGHTAFVICFFAIPIGLAKIIEQLTAALKKRAFSTLRLVSFITIASSGPVGLVYAHNAVEMNAVSLIVELDRYYQKHGQYPASLAEITAIDIPRCTNSHDMFYWRNESNDSYSLGCVTFAFNKFLYHSNTQQWGSFD